MNHHDFFRLLYTLYVKVWLKLLLKCDWIKLMLLMHIILNMHVTKWIKYHTNVVIPSISLQVHIWHDKKDIYVFYLLLDIICFRQWQAYVGHSTSIYWMNKYSWFKTLLYSFTWKRFNFLMLRISSYANMVVPYFCWVWCVASQRNKKENSFILIRTTLCCYQ